MNIKDVFNKWLFSPARYLDQDGHPIHLNALARILSLPEIKMTVAGTALAAAFALAASGKEDAKNTFYVGGSVLAALAMNQRQSLFSYYLDTEPDRQLPIPHPFIQIDLELKADNQRLVKQLKEIMLAAAGGGALLYVVTGNAVSCVTFPALVTTAISTKRIASWWRANEVLDGNWNIMTNRPDPEEKSLVSPETSVQAYIAVPVPVRN